MQFYSRLKLTTENKLIVQTQKIKRMETDHYKKSSNNKGRQ